MLCPFEMKIGLALQKPVSDWGTGIFSSTGGDHDKTKKDRVIMTGSNCRDYFSKQERH